MNEIGAWNALTDKAQAKVMESGTKLVSWSRRMASSVTPAGPAKLLNGQVACDIESVNKAVLGRYDKEILRQLDRLRRDGVERPLLPLYVAIWKQAMEVQVSDKEEMAVLLLMLRVQGTAQVAVNMNTDPSNQETVREMRQRGLLQN